MFVSNQNIYHCLMRRELGGSFSSQKVKNRFLVKNIEAGNCVKKTFNGHSEEIVSFDVKDYFAVTRTESEIKLWNLETGKCQWTRQMVNSRVFGLFSRVFSQVKISEEYVVESGTHDINILNLKTGEKITSIKEEMDNVCVIGQRIFFSLCSNRRIGEWTIQGENKGTIHSALRAYSSFFEVSKNFLVVVSANQFFVYNLQEKNRLELQKTVPGSDDAVIQSVYLREDHLICAYKDWDEKEEIYACCCIVDLITGEIKNHKISVNQESVINKRVGSSFKLIKKIHSYKEFIYLGLYSGEIIAIDMTKNTLKILEGAELFFTVDYLALEGQTLIGGFSKDDGFPIATISKVKFWNIHSLEPIGEMELPKSIKIHFDSGKLLAIVGKSLIQWDYLV